MQVLQCAIYQVIDRSTFFRGELPGEFADLVSKPLSGSRSNLPIGPQTISAPLSSRS